MKPIKVLVACEESQVVCTAFRRRGITAYSCDVLPPSGDYPEYHIQDDVRKYLNNDWTLIIAHPPCTYLTLAGNKWFKPEYNDRFPDRYQQREDAVNFFMTLYNAPVKYIAVENPVGIMSTRFRKPNQYIEPYYFGHRERKKTGLWLRNLPELKPTNVVEPVIIKLNSGATDSPRHYDSMTLPAKERARVRSVTFTGIADAMAKQWGDYIHENETRSV